MPSRLRACSCRAIALLVSVAALLPAVAVAQAPTIAGLQPQAVAPGTATNLKVRGGNLGGTVELMTSFTADNGLAPDIPDNGKNAAEVTWKLNVPSNTPVGIYGVRVATPGGVSPLRLIMVDDLPSVAASGANGSFAQAQEITLPTAVDGTIGSLGLHYYKFKAEAGQRVAIEVVARRMGSTLDPMIRLFNAQGRELAYSDDVSGLRSDAQLCVALKDAGEYVIEVRDIRYQGGGDYVYRLRVGDFPCIAATHPLSVQRGQTAKIQFAGPHAADVPPADVTVPADYPFRWMTVSAKRPGGQSSGFAVLKVSDRTEAIEAEPNGEIAQANRIEVGQAINGRIEKSGDVDHFVFAGKKGQSLKITAITQRSGAATAVLLRLLNKSGGQLATKEDFGAGDATLTQAVPEDSEFVLAVEELHSRGGSEFVYRVEIEPAQPGFSLEAAANTVNIGATSVAAVTVTATRENYGGPIQISVAGLPEGVTSLPTVIGPGASTAVLTIRSNTDTPLSRTIPIQIVGTAKIGERDVREIATTEGAMKAAFANVSWAPQTLAQDVALSVGAKPKVRFRTEPAEVVFGQNLSANVKLIVDRDEGFDEVVNFALTPEANKGGLPANVTVELKPIAKGTNEIEAVFKATDKAALGDFTAVLNGTIKQGNATVTEPTPGITLKLQVPLQVTATPAAEKFAAGAQLNVKVTVARNPALKGDVVLTFANLPKGVTAAAATIPADKSEAEVALTAAADAAKGAVNNIQIKGEVTVGNAKFAGTSPNITLTVE